MKVKIRPLQEKDAAISYKWRNNPNVWKYTSNKPNRIVTYEDELVWIRNVLKRNDEKRFAICVADDEQYIGNIQLTDINDEVAQLHIFIGELDFHGKGIGTKSILLLLDYAFSELDLKSIYLFVNKKNINAIKLYKKCGFLEAEETGEVIKMEIHREN